MSTIEELQQRVVELLRDRQYWSDQFYLSAARNRDLCDRIDDLLNQVEKLEGADKRASQRRTERDLLADAYNKQVRYTSWFLDEYCEAHDIDYNEAWERASKEVGS